jgi:gluconate 2-dehydrogenase alpha chain
MAIELKKTDVVIIGLGAAGGVAALPLTLAGLNVVGLEAGSWLTPRDFAPDELRNNFRGWPQAAQKANNEIPTHRPNASAPYSPRLPVHPMMNAVGGTSLHYWAQSWRLNPWDFKVVSETTRRYGASRIPKGSTVEDWPFGLEELEAYYDKIEHEVGVSGQAGNIDGAIDPRGNIFEGRANAAIRCRHCAAPNSPTAWPRRRASSAGIRSQARLRSIRQPMMSGRAACITASVTAAAATSAPRTRPRSAPSRRRLRQSASRSCRRRSPPPSSIDDRSGRVTGVVYVKGGIEYFQPADVVLLASYTYENVRLLLQSKSRRFQTGSPTMAGRSAGIISATSKAPQYLRCSRSTSTTGTACRPKASRSTTGRTTISIILASTSSAAAICGSIQIGARSAPPACRRSARHRRLGREVEILHQENADRFNVAYLQKTTLPYEDNYLDLDPVEKDPMGFPVIRITAEYKDNEKRMGRFIQDKMAQWFMEAGAIAVEKGPIRHHGTLDPRLRWHSHGRQPRDQRRRSLRLFPRGTEPRNSRGLCHGHQRRPQSDADGAGAGLAHRRAPHRELDGNRQRLRLALAGS